METPAGLDPVPLARRYGSLLTVAAASFGIVYAIGLLRRSYWTLALPVGAVTLAGVGATLWIGRLLMTTPDEPREF
jgi:hypothetical protein